MPSNSDKATASIPIEGRAATIRLRRPRPDRDGLYLFGRRYRAQELPLTNTDLTALRAGRTIAVDVMGEYILYVRWTSHPGTETGDRGDW